MKKARDNYKRNHDYEKIARDLLERYETRIMRGEEPEPKWYFARYPGPDKDDFKHLLNITTLLAVDGVIQRKREEEKRNTNAEYLDKNYKKLRQQYPEHWIAICDGRPVVIERDHDKFMEAVEKKFVGRKVLQAYIPASESGDRIMEMKENGLGAFVNKYMGE